MKEQGHAIHGNTTFPMVLREHLDSDICIERKIVLINYSVITKKKELVKHLKMVKITKQQVLITSKGNYIEHWEKVRYVSRQYKKYFRI